MKVSVLSIAIVGVLFGANAYANANFLLNSDEASTLAEINTVYETSHDALNVDGTINRYNQVESDISLIKVQLISNEEYIRSGMNLLQTKILKGEFDSELSSSLQVMANNVNTYNSALDAKNNELSGITVDLENKKTELAAIEKTKNEQLISLYDSTKGRLIAESKKTIDTTFTGKLTCDKDESLRDCVSRSEPSMKRSFQLSLGGIDSTKITKFEIVDAMQNFKGVMRYEIAASYNQIYSDSMDKDLRSVLDLEKIRFVLRSNSDSTVYYINEERVGKGKRVELSGNYIGIYDVHG
ncbi:hypothetical protein [Vibrio campbellii]|uniref:hypothetical protein n=1 Tax=Vibrio campbellii TaxID=680 RepID=UPI000CD37031|nr:hypothetical protein [Vibrio campbellii]AUW07425.1 hypothetical protein C1N51_27610 [Vibrio campbellii]